MMSRESDWIIMNAHAGLGLNKIWRLQWTVVEHASTMCCYE